MSALLGPILGPRGGARPDAVTKPTGFAWLDCSIREEVAGGFTCAVDERALLITPARVLYVDGDPANLAASDANAGTDPAAPLRSINVAINKWNVDQTIYVKQGWYPLARSWVGGVPFNGHVNVIGVRDFTTLAPGWFVSSASEEVTALTWADVGGGEWTAPVANAPYAVVDVSTSPPTWFTLAADAGSVDAPGEYFHGGGIIRVATLTGAQPGANLRILRDAVHNGWCNTALNVTVVRGTFEGGGNNRAFWFQHVARGTLIDCAFTLSESVGFELNSSAAGVVHRVNLIRCRAYDNTADGFAYTATGAGSEIRALEVGCEATRNGRNAGSNQGSSMHFSVGNAAAAVVRVGGRYHGNEAQELADVGGSVAWMLGVDLDGEGGGNGYEMTGASTAYLHGCLVQRVAASGGLVAGAGSTINVANTFYPSSSGAGTVQQYTP